MTETARISLLKQTDAPMVTELIYCLIDELSDGSGPDRTAMAATARHVLALESVFGFLATKNSEPIGVIMLNECAAIYAGGKFGEISELYVSPEYRSAGLAGHLVQAAKNHASDRGWKRLEVGAPPQPAWERTMQFYLREGFEEVGPRLRLALG